MIRGLLFRSFTLAEPWLRHDKWLVRRTAQAAVMVVIWLMLPRVEKARNMPSERSGDFAEQLSLSTRLMEFLDGPAILKPLLGRA
jgi:hypothetical protein